MVAGKTKAISAMQSTGENGQERLTLKTKWLLNEPLTMQYEIIILCQIWGIYISELRRM